jgi:4a-hydroxytetrahydrobiopterin dehydratase
VKILITEKQSKLLNSDWEVVKGKLCKSFKFKTYKEVINFVNKIGEIAEKQNHHPDMIVKYDEVIVTMYDHEEGGISEKCYKFTNEVDEILMNQEELGERSRSFAFTRKKRLFSKPEIMANPNRYKLRDKELKGLDEDKKESGEKYVTCINCKTKFTQTIHKGKKSLPICPKCGTHNNEHK